MSEKTKSTEERETPPSEMLFNEIHTIDAKILAITLKLRQRVNDILEKDLTTKPIKPEELPTNLYKNNGNLQMAADLKDTEFKNAIDYILLNSHETTQSDIKSALAEASVAMKQLTLKPEVSPPAAVEASSTTEATASNASAAHASEHAWSRKSFFIWKKESWNSFTSWNGPLYVPTTWPAKTVWLLKEAFIAGEAEMKNVRKKIKEAGVHALNNKAAIAKGAAWGTVYLPVVGTVIGGIVRALGKGETKAGDTSSVEHH